MDPETVACAARSVLEESRVKARGNRVISKLEHGRQQALLQIIEDAEAE